MNNIKIESVMINHERNYTSTWMNMKPFIGNVSISRSDAVAESIVGGWRDSCIQCSPGGSVSCGGGNCFLLRKQIFVDTYS